MGKKVYLVLKSGRIYIGHVLEEKEDCFLIKDRKGFQVLLNRADISILQEEA